MVQIDIKLLQDATVEVYTHVSKSMMYSYSRDNKIIVNELEMTDQHLAIKEIKIYKDFEFKLSYADMNELAEAKELTENAQTFLLQIVYKILKDCKNKFANE